MSFGENIKAKLKGKGKGHRMKICLSLSCKTIDDIKSEIAKYLQYADCVEWCVNETEGHESWRDKDYISILHEIKKLLRSKKLIVTYKENTALAIHLLKLSMGEADLIDIDFRNPDINSLLRMAKRKKTKTIISYHDYEKMPSKNEIAEQYIRMESLGGDILKIACMAKEESDTFEILEGAAMYRSLKNPKDIIAIAMGEEGQTSRICAGDFGSVISYGYGSVRTAPGQLNVVDLKNYIEKYDAEKGN